MNQPRGKKINVFLPVRKCEAGNEAPPNAAPAIRPCKKAKVHPSLTTGEKGGKKNPNVIFLSPGIFFPGEPQGCWIFVGPLG